MTFHEWVDFISRTERWFGRMDAYADLLHWASQVSNAIGAVLALCGKPWLWVFALGLSAICHGAMLWIFNQIDQRQTLILEELKKP